MAVRRWVEKLRAWRGRRDPALVLAVAAAAFLALTVASQGFRGVRGLFGSLPYRNPGELVTVTQKDLIGQTLGVPIRAFRLWQQQSTSFSGLAGYVFARDVARVTPNFFPLLGSGAWLGRTLDERDGPAPEARVVVSYEFWRDRLGGDPGAVGKQIEVGRVRAVLVGVLPRDFWALSERVQAWMVLSLRGLPPPVVGAVGRLKPGVSPDRAQAELSLLARREKMRVAGPFLAQLRRHDRTILAFYGACLAAGLLMGLAVMKREAMALQRKTSLRPGWRYWLFFVSKTVLLLAVSAGFWIETSRAARMALSGWVGAFVTDLLFTWMFFISVSIAVLWSYRDQMRRCPVCLGRLALPVTIGSWSSALLDPVSTEFLCEQGHGTLCVPETESSASEPERWTALDASWRDLFTRR